MICVFKSLVWRLGGEGIPGQAWKSEHGFYFGWETALSAPLDLTVPKRPSRQIEDPGWGPRCPSSGGGTFFVRRPAVGTSWSNEMSPKFSIRQD